MTRTTQVNKDDQANSNTRPRVGGARPRVFQAAQTTCNHLWPGSDGFTGSGAGTHQQLLHALKVVACMHSHGYPNWPDPVGGRVVYPVGVDTHSTQFQAANKTCGLGAPAAS
jgi:hypothetical protein